MNTKDDVKEPNVLAIIVTWNKKDYVTGLLESLRSMDYANCSVVVVDNASTDGTSEWIKEAFPQVRLIENSENLGGSGGFNTGLAYAFGLEGYKYFWLLDNDVEVSKGALRALVSALEAVPGAAVAGSMMCQLDNRSVTNELGAFVDLRNGRLVLHRHLTRMRNNSTGIFDVDYAAAASMLVRADVAKAAGLWEDFFIHFDDVDWCLRIKEMGHRIIAVADSVIWHLSAFEKPVTWVQYYDVRNMLYVLKRHAGGRDVARFGIRKCLQAGRCELKGMGGQARIILDGVGDFLSGKKGKKEISFPFSGVEKIRGILEGKDVFVHQNEWFDLRKFPFDGTVEISGVLLPPYLTDALYYWRRNSDIKAGLMSPMWLWRLRGLMGLVGLKRYDVVMEDIRLPSAVLSMMSRMKIIRADEENHLVVRTGTFEFLKRLFMTGSRAVLYMVRFLSGRV